MALVTPNLGLRVWNLPTDPYDSDQLAENWARVDQHDHTPGKGALIQTASLMDGAVTADKVAPTAFPTIVLQDGAVTTVKLADASVTTAKYAPGSVDSNALGPGAVTLPAVGHDVLPPGIIWMYGGSGSSVPTGWLLCDGSAISRTTYANLFAVLGTGNGAGDGINTFNLPDLRGRLAVGVGIHNDVNALGKTDSKSLSLRRPTHTHTHITQVFDWNNTAAIERSYEPSHTNSDGSVQSHYDAPGSFNTLYKLGSLDQSGFGNPYRYQITSSPDGTAYATVNYIIKT